MNILIVCMANYCRSPVAEKILESELNDKFYVSSAGLNPVYFSSMDKRSLDFLKSEGIRNLLHFPRKVSKKDITDNDFIFALDLKILNILIKKFPKYAHKIKLLNYMDINISLDDPYKYGEESYNRIMREVKKACQLLVIEIHKDNEA